MYIKAEKMMGLHKSMILKAVKLRWELWENLSSCQDVRYMRVNALSKKIKIKIKFKVLLEY